MFDSRVIVRLNCHLFSRLPEIVVQLLVDVQIRRDTLSQELLAIDGQLEVVTSLLHLARAVWPVERPHWILEQHQLCVLPLSLIHI